MKKFIPFLIFVLFTVFVYSQNLNKNGKFNNRIYSIDDFGSSAQIWTGDQAINGNVYFGNDNLILEFNGYKWSKIYCDSTIINSNILKQVNLTKVTKIFTSKNGTTYVGRENNFGVLKYNNKGKIYYHPLKVGSTKYNLGEIWNIFEVKNEIFVICKNKIYSIQDNNKLKEISLTKEFNDFSCSTAAKIKSKIILSYKSDSNNKRKYLEFDPKNHSFKKVYTLENVNSIRGSIELNGKAYIFNTNSNVFIYDEATGFKNANKLQNILKKHNINFINCVKEINNKFYIGTEKDGLFILNEKFEIIRQLNLSDGMESVNVFDIFFDRENNLWLNLDNGIHFFEFSSPLTFFNKTNGISERIVNIDFDKKQYLSTNSGIFESQVVNNQKTFVNSKILDEEVFDLLTYKTSFGKKTLCVGYSGIYEINYEKYTKNKIVNEISWKIFQNPINKDEFFIGNESSLGKLTLTSKGWSYKNIILDLKGEIRNFTSVNDLLIFGVSNEGIYIFDLKTEKISKINKNLITKYFVETYKNRVYVGMTTGLYYLNRSFTKLLPFSEINNKFIGTSKLLVHRLYNESNKKLWVVTYSELNENDFKIETGWLQVKKKKWDYICWPLIGIDLYKGGIVYDIKKYKENEIWLAANNGLFIFNRFIAEKMNMDFSVSIDEISINKEIEINNPSYSKNIENIPYNKNSLNFIFHANTFKTLKNLKYRYKLSNLMDDWSDWTDLNFANFQKLNEGEYHLYIQAKNGYGFKSNILQYDFTILPPWYRTWWAYVLYTIGLLYVIYLIIQISLKRVKNQNIKLEEIVKERTSEIAQQNTVLEHQKVEIEQKTKDIVDSIVYAKRIQETILPTERLPNLFNDYFVFYRPKDIVSGDFYWARKKEEEIIFAAIDCTGHGVPGALVSIVGNAALLRCVNEHQLNQPAEILDKLRDIVVKSFDSKGQQDVKDGMDMSLCTLNTSTNILKYAGANNECVIIRNKEIIELKPDKQPIGYFSHATPFKQQEIQLIKGDCVYQYTDGYVDQFGGEKGKKLKSRPFKEFLVEISHHNMNKQNQLIQEKFDTWKLNFDQVDDVCVFGIKIS